MGLRLWKDPDDEVVADDAAAKLDRAAAARRSTIRRETSVRPGRDQWTPQSMSTILRSRHQSMLRTRDRLRQEERETDAQIEDLQAELHRLQQRRLQNRSRLDQAIRAPRAGQDMSTLSPDIDVPHQDVITEPNTGIPRDAREALPQPPTVNVPRFEHLQFPTSRSSSPWRYQVLSRTTMPSPPRSAGSRRGDSSIPDGPIPGESWSTNSPHMPALTEGFAPARAGQSTASQLLDAVRAVDDIRSLETPSPGAGEGEWPRLHRVHHMSPPQSMSPSPPPRRVDGLGDRRRSLSPFSANLWAAMEESSGSSSFTSSYSDRLRHSNNSSQATSTSFGEIGALDDTCELDLPEGITQDDVRAIRARYFTQYSGQPPLPARQDIMSTLFTVREHMHRNGNTEYDMFDSISERVLRREPIPPEDWITVGLSPDFGRRFS